MLPWRLGKSAGQALLCHSFNPLYSYNCFSILNSSSKFINPYLQPSQGNPFTGRRNYIGTQDTEDVQKPSLQNLLGSPRRDYVITNKGKKVPIHTLEEKVVGLYFYVKYNNDVSPEDILNVYNELAKTKDNFEVVLIYLNDGPTCDEESYWKVFKTMPWLALPFKDPNIHKLERIFEFLPNHFDEDYDHWNQGPSLVIFGPHGEFIEPLGGYILTVFSVSAYPFIREKVAKIEAEKVQKLKMEMIWDPNTVFTRTDGSLVKFSQLVGKKVLLFFETRYSCENNHHFLIKLKERYLESRGTNDEFEVIHILEDEKYTKRSMQDLPWLVSLVSDLLPGGYDFYTDGYVEFVFYSTLLAFDEDGNVVRRTLFPVHEDTKFPFYSGSVEEETLSMLINSLKLDYWNYYPNKGRIYTFHKKLRQPSCRNIIGSGHRVWSFDM